MQKQKFDVVVIGGGSAGCALANRLCASGDLSVALVEAGPDYGPFSEGRWPSELLDPRFDPTSHDWGFQAQRPEGSEFFEARAKVMGGCSSHNDCAAIWGVPQDYDGWAEAGNPGWSYKDLKPLIQQVEGTSSDSVTPFRGQNGPLYTRRHPEEDLSVYQRYFIESCLAEGFLRVGDMSASEPAEGVASYHGNVKDSVRWNAAFAFLDPIRGNPNLTILDHTLTDRLIVKGQRVEGVIAHARGEDLELTAEQVVLSAGAYGSPSILMRSGIGPAAHLRELGISEAVGLEGVGRNLHDHPSFYIAFKPTESGWDEVVRDLGEDSVYRGQIMLKVKSPYCQGLFDLHILASQVPRTLEAGTLESFICNMAPRSRGQVFLTGKDPTLAPRIETRYLTDDEGIDAAILVYALRVLRRITAKEPLASILDSELDPWHDLRTDKEITDYLKKAIVNYSHAVGTCKMGPSSDPEAVVDTAGKVYGIENLYVADASIMPTIPLANTNLTSMLIGMKVAAGLLNNSA